MRRREARAAALLCVALLTAFAASARASYDPVGSGATKLTLDKGFVAFLKRAGVRLTASQGAKREGGIYLLPVVGGQIDPVEGRGEANAEGVLSFTSQGRRVPLRGIRIEASRQPLVAKAGGSQLKLATAKRTTARRAGFGTKLTSVELRLTAKLITRLNKKLRPKAPFGANQLLGTLVTNAQPRLATIEEKGTATITLDPGFLAKLDSLFVSLNPIAPAQRFGAQATFPIAVGGAIAPDGSEGTLRTGGALEFLQLGSGQVFWSEPWLDLAARSDTAEVDIEPTPAFPGKIGRAGVLDLGAAAFTPDPRARTISVSGAPLVLSAAAAQSFNEAFAQGEPPAFSAGEAVGSVSFTAQGQ
ncbi:MAG TPA: hypothetical protein VNS60_10600 [Solirubrobacterales bacterium]|nr:hypothetical protein [Solirubrobacterales bacterium]